MSRKVKLVHRMYKQCDDGHHKTDDDRLELTRIRIKMILLHVCTYNE